MENTERDTSGMVPDEAINDQGNVTEHQQAKRDDDKNTTTEGDRSGAEGDKPAPKSD